MIENMSTVGATSTILNAQNDMLTKFIEWFMINDKVCNRNKMFYHTMALDLIAKPYICKYIGPNEQWEYLFDTSEYFNSLLSKYLENFVKGTDRITFTDYPPVQICKGLVDGVKHMYLVIHVDMIYTTTIKSKNIGKR